tara:strand:- start:273 stop:608 length:336 start_codon:yes stop_codon:yes gene_type:complete
VVALLLIGSIAFFGHPRLGYLVKNGDGSFGAKLFDECFIGVNPFGVFKPKDWNSCVLTCLHYGQSCRGAGNDDLSNEVCKGGEKMCIRDCCVMFQSSDAEASAWCTDGTDR